MAKEYIERETLLAEYDRQHTGEPGRARKLIEDAPAVDVVEVVHGRWEPRMQDDGYGEYLLYFCSECGAVSPNMTRNYCQNCGCRMDKDGE